MLLSSNISLKATSEGYWQEFWSELPRMIGFDTKSGRGYDHISALTTLDDEHVFIGYGDWNNNDGPTDLVSLNPKTQQYTVHEKSVPSESLGSIKVIDDRVYALYTDPTGFWNDTEPFTTYPKLPYPIGKAVWVHVFDIIKHNNALWVFGSSIANDQFPASASSSIDGGKTWTHYYFDTGTQNTDANNFRAYYAWIDDAGTLWCHVNGGNDSGNSLYFNYSWNGTSWNRHNSSSDPVSKKQTIEVDFLLPFKANAITKSGDKLVCSVGDKLYIADA